MKELLPLLPRPSRYLGSEWGAVRKDPARVAVHVALAFPDLYEVGMSYLGQKILLKAVNDHEEFLAERVFSVCKETAAILREHDTPLATLETDTPLGELDAVAFSLTHELCYTNVLEILDLAGIPVRAADRGDEHPLVMAGGGVVGNAEPLAAFLDLMVLGDGEEVLPLILHRLRQAKEAGLGRAEFLRSLTGTPGVYLPGLFEFTGRSEPLRPLLDGYDHVERAVVTDLESVAYPTDQAISLTRAVHDRLTLEVARGCTRGCRFCQAGMIYRPVRERGPEALAAIMDQGLKATGFEETSLLSLSTGDHTALEQVFTNAFDRCAGDQVSIAMPSLRVGSLTPSILARMASIRRTGITLAPEAGSQRLRDVINKNVTEEGLINHVRILFGAGWQMVKLYFMIGLPTETDEDLAAIAELSRKVRDAAGPGVKRLQVTSSVSPFVPKPHTPFQWEEQMDLDETRRRIGILRDAFRPLKRVKLKFHEPRMSYLEGVFSRGDRALAPVVEAAWKAGALFSSWKDHLELDPYLDALAANGLGPADYLAARDPDGPLPWDHLLAGPGKGWLKAERSRALAASTIPDCRFGKCSGCGVCTEDADGAPRKSLLTAQAEHTVIRPRLAHRGEPPTPTEPPPLPDPLKETVQDRDGAGQDQTREALSRRAAHYRIWYDKTGPAAFLSQLELQSTLERAMRRAGLPLTFSQGFHPMPRISFGRALPVDVESRCEWFTVFLREIVPGEAVRRALAPVLPQGLGLLRVEEIGPGRKVSQAVGESFELEFTVEPDKAEAWRKRWLELPGKKSFPVMRKTKRGRRETDVLGMLSSVSRAGEETLRLDFDWSAAYMNPLSVIRAVLPEASLLDFRLTKVEQRLGKLK